MSVDLVLRLPEMNVASGTDGFAKLLAQPDDDAVELPQILLASGVTVAEHEGIVAQGLNFQIVVKDAMRFSSSQSL